jgi:hypothetical protein
MKQMTQLYIAHNMKNITWNKKKKASRLFEI